MPGSGQAFLACFEFFQTIDEEKGGERKGGEDANYQYEDIDNLQNQMASFEATKGDIVSSSLGQAIGLTESSIWSQVIEKIKAVVNRGTLNWSGSNTTQNVEAGYYPGGTLDSRPSYNNGYNAGVTDADGRANPESTNYKTGYNVGVAAADNRVNTGSASYKSGYNAGVNAGKNSMTWQVVSKDSTTANNNVTTTVPIPAGYQKFYGYCSIGIPSTRHSISINNATVQSTWIAEDNYSEGVIFYGTLNGEAKTLTITTWTTSTKTMKIRGIVCYA